MHFNGFLSTRLSLTDHSRIYLSDLFHKVQPLATVSYKSVHFLLSVMGKIL